MKRLILGLVLLAFTGCVAGTDPTVQCPDDKNKQLTRAEWEACNGRQEPADKGP